MSVLEWATVMDAPNDALNTSHDQSVKAKIILADDHPLLLKSLRDLLVKEGDFEIIAEAGDGGEAVRLTIEMQPDIVIMDISMPEMDGLEATRQIKERCPKVAVLVLTVHTDDDSILDILQAGAAGYLVKSVYTDEVIHSIHAVLSGEMVLSPSIGQRLLKHAARYPIRPVSLEAGEKLSIRELEILKLTARGMSNKDIASTLGINIRTVKAHLGEIFSKMGVASRTEAVITGLRTDILSLDDLQ